MEENTTTGVKNGKSKGTSKTTMKSTRKADGVNAGSSTNIENKNSSQANATPESEKRRSSRQLNSTKSSTASRTVQVKTPKPVVVKDQKVRVSRHSKLTLSPPAPIKHPAPRNPSARIAYHKVQTMKSSSASQLENAGEPKQLRSKVVVVDLGEHDPSSSDSVLQKNLANPLPSDQEEILIENQPGGSVPMNKSLSLAKNEVHTMELPTLPKHTEKQPSLGLHLDKGIGSSAAVAAVQNSYHQSHPEIHQKSTANTSKNVLLKTHQSETEASFPHGSSKRTYKRLRECENRTKEILKTLNNLTSGAAGNSAKPNTTKKPMIMPPTPPPTPTPSLPSNQISSSNIPLPEAHGHFNNPSSHFGQYPNVPYRQIESTQYAPIVYHQPQQYPQLPQIDQHVQRAYVPQVVQSAIQPASHFYPVAQPIQGLGQTYPPFFSATPPLHHQNNYFYQPPPQTPPYGSSQYFVQQAPLATQLSQQGPTPQPFISIPGYPAPVPPPQHMQNFSYYYPTQ